MSDFPDKSDSGPVQPEAIAPSLPVDSVTYIIRKQPIWTFFLTPIAVLVGALLIGGAIWVSDDDASGDDAAASALPTVAAGLPTQAVAQPGSGQQATLLSTFNRYAQSIGIDVTQFQACLSKQTNVDFIQRQLQQGNALGVTGTPTFFINNKMLVGAQPAAIFDEIIRAELSGASPTTLDGYSANIKALAAASPPRFIITAAAPDISEAHIKGVGAPKLVIAEFSDFQCPFCKSWFDTTLPGLRRNWESQGVALAFLHFPLTQIHPNAGNASVASICAAEQDKFWEMHDLLFARQAEWEKLAQ